ncbi:1-deoxyxylulose-5-phosphate synthase YajO-like [Tigriopus californicus]|uniref:1-deoxyxylulose-5-phosphate synthase YajO-like n=1 Tax=Tigriopus californicus TaxID=6832 RepID=UPI0027D9E60A|nr:1-deoxyxylulose-5-phosphate synthase YajO-like [Tigriopus californicus]
MEYRYLGNTGLKVSNLCLGTMTFGENPNRPGQADEKLSHEIMDAFVESGGNFIDTADCYQMGLTEKIVGKWLQKQPRRDKIIIATKLAQAMRDDDPNCAGLSRHHIITNVEESLERLQTSYIDLLYVHVWDHGTPIQETLSALSDLVRCGKVHYIGASNFTGWQILTASETSKSLGLEKFCCLQQQYNLIVREIEWEVTEACSMTGMGLIPWSPLKGGWLSGKIHRGSQGAPTGSRVAFAQETGKANQSGPDFDSLAAQPRVWNILDQLKKTAASHGKTVAQVAIRWLLQRPNVPSVVIGAKTLGQLQDNLGAVSFQLSLEEMKSLDEASALPAPYPYEMIQRLNTKRVR